MNQRKTTLQDRHVLAKRWAAGDNAVQIAVDLGFSPDTIYKELRRGYTGKLNRLSRPAYDPEMGQAVYQANLRNRGRRKKKEDDLHA